MTEKLGRFGHHPDPAIDFCVEVDVLEGLYYDMRVGLPTPENAPVGAARVLEFNVGGDALAIAAKARLRELAAG